MASESRSMKRGSALPGALRAAEALVPEALVPEALVPEAEDLFDFGAADFLAIVAVGLFDFAPAGLPAVGAFLPVLDSFRTAMVPPSLGNHSNSYREPRQHNLLRFPASDLSPGSA